MLKSRKLDVIELRLRVYQKIEKKVYKELKDKLVGGKYGIHENWRTN